MTSRPYNAPPKYLVAPDLRMPFSSPMGEEVASPTSDPSHTPPQMQQHHKQMDVQMWPGWERGMPQKYTISTTTGKRTPNHILRDSPQRAAGFVRPPRIDSRNASPARPPRIDSRNHSPAARRIETRNASPAPPRITDTRSPSPARSKWPGLNVITDFTKGMDAVTGMSKPKNVTNTNQARTPSRSAHARAQSRQYKPVSHFSDATLSATSAYGRGGSTKSRKSSGSKGRIEDIKSASSKVSGLSPSDRAVVIGIDISPDKVTRQSTEQSRHELDGQTEHERRPSLTPSVTPSILITPADEEEKWAESEKNQSREPRRPTSSVYSQLPATRPREYSNVPPVPPLNLDIIRQQGLSREPSDAKGQRVVSTATVFDEEPSSGAVSARPRPEVEVLRKAGSADTDSPKHGSQGWWNVLKSPFFPKSPPDTYPSVKTNGYDSRNFANDEEVEHANLLGRNRVSCAESARTSWTDSSTEAACEKKALNIEPSAPAAEVANNTDPVRMPDETTFRRSKLDGLGAASEYFEACVYDMHSGTPFYECQNHVCHPSLLRLSTIGNIATGDIPSTGQRGLDLGDGLNPARRTQDTLAPPAQGQKPQNPFSAVFGEVTTPPKRVSEVTVIEDWDATPDIHEAKSAPLIKAPRPVTQAPRSRTQPNQESDPFSDSDSPDPIPKALPTPPPKPPAKDYEDERYQPASKPTPLRPPYVFGLPNNPRPKRLEEPLSPEPPTPGVPSHAPSGAIAMNDVPLDQSDRGPSPATVTHTTNPANHFYPNQSAQRSETSTVHQGELWPPPHQGELWAPLHKKQERDYDPFADLWTMEKKFDPPPRQEIKKPGMFAKIKAALIPGQQKRNDNSKWSKGEKKKRRLLIIVGVILLLLIILIMVLAMTLTRKGDKMPAQSSWVNITGYPPIPTGISTIAQPDAVQQQSGCVQPTSMWSCALPKEEQQANAPAAPNQPAFRFEIRFQNGTNATSGLNTNTSSLPQARSLHVVNAVSASSFIRRRFLQLRDSLTSSLYTPSPAPPSLEDQTFLGNTTDGNHAPFDGEFTPFFMTLESAAPLTSSLLKRNSKSSSPSNSSANSTDPFPDLTKSIPAPSTNPDGTAAAALLYPIPSAQPLRLYDRGLASEHYGFYTYFDRSIFLSSAAPLNASSITGNPEPDSSSTADANGGSLQANASVRCTWSQTRFLVQIWTRKNSSSLLPSPASNSNSKNKTSSTANDFVRPGSFPYPVSLTLDRHGGALDKKMIYCYGLDGQSRPIASAKRVQLEDRAFGGALVNPALGPWGKVNVSAADGGPGGIDGGQGGCSCLWQNWH